MNPTTATRKPDPIEPEPAKAAQADEDAGDERRRMDPEIRALSAIMRTLDAMDPAARARAVRWFSDRYLE